MSKYAHAVSAATVLAACVAFIALIRHALHYFFLYDDFALIGIAGGTSWRTLATTPQIGFFRPLPFLMMRAEFVLVRWTSASAYAAAALLIHLANAALVGVLARKIGVRRQLAITAATLFLLSAAAGEGYFWLSSTFDRLCVLGTLVAAIAGVLAVSATNSRTEWAWRAAGLLGTAVALLSKESGVVIPALSLALLVMAGVPIRRKAAPYVALQCALAIPLLAYRQSVLPRLGGAYGPLGELFARANVPANLVSYAASIAHPPLPWHDTSWLAGHLSGTAALLSAASWLIVLTVLGLRRPVALASAVGAALVTIAPVAWVGIVPGTTASGRFLYMPGIVVALLPALALEFGTTKRLDVLQAITSIAVIVILSVQTASVWYQAAIWRLGSDIARQTMDEMRSYGKFERPLYIENMPAVFIEGPFILKDYAFSLYFGSTFKPGVRARGMALKVVDGRPVFSNWMDQDDRRPAERVVLLHALGARSDQR